MSDPRMVQALEQAQAFLRDFAPVIARYYHRLVQERVPPAYAAALAAAMQAHIMSPTRQQGE